MRRTSTHLLLARRKIVPFPVDELQCVNNVHTPHVTRLEAILHEESPGGGRPLDLARILDVGAVAFHAHALEAPASQIGLADVFGGKRCDPGTVGFVVFGLVLRCNLVVMLRLVSNLIVLLLVSRRIVRTSRSSGRSCLYLADASLAASPFDSLLFSTEMIV